MKRLLLSIVFSLFAFSAQAKDYILYYFHSNVRCATCKKFESWTTQTAQNLPVEFKIINTDSKENAHYLTDYSLYTKSVVITDNQGNFKNLDKIWNYNNNQNAFMNYVSDEVKAFIGENKQ